MERRLIVQAVRLLSEDAGHTWRCLDEMEIAAYAEGRLDPRSRQRVEFHLAKCGFCLGQVGFLVRNQTESFPEEVPKSLVARARDFVDRRRNPPLAPAWAWGSAAAALGGLAIMAVLSFQKPELVIPHAPMPGPPSSTVRPATPVQKPSILSSPSVRGPSKKSNTPRILSPLEDATITRGKIEFRWRGVGESQLYEVHLVTAEGDLVWTGRTQGTEIAPPPDVQLVPGRKYYVWVVALSPAGQGIKSPAVSFRVAEGR
jgi:hypothetical protein